MADAGLYLKRDNLKSLITSIKTLTSHDVLVGYPEGGPPRQEPGEPTNAYIAFVQEHGSPARNIPARPFMVPGIKSVQTRATRMLEQAAIAGLSGESRRSMQILNELGLIGVAAVQRAITRGEGWPPLAPSTLAARRRRGVRRTHPLIDTGQLRQHVTYVIRRKARRFTFPDDNTFLQRVKRTNTP
jgi:hypothetical protein